MNRDELDDIKVGKKDFTEVFRSRVHIKRLGKDYEKFRRDVTNRFVARSRKHPHNVAEANMQLEHYDLTHFIKKKVEHGSHHLLDSSSKNKRFVCCEYDRCKPEHKGTKFCRFTKRMMDWMQMVKMKSIINLKG